MFLSFFSCFHDILAVFTLCLTNFLLTLQPKRKIWVLFQRRLDGNSQKKRFKHNDEKNKNARVS